MWHSACLLAHFPRELPPALFPLQGINHGWLLKAITWGERSMCQKKQNVAWNNTEKGKEVLENAEVKERRSDYRQLERIFFSPNLVLKSWEKNLLFPNCRTSKVSIIFQSFNPHSKKSNYFVLAAWYVEVGWNILRHQMRNCVHIFTKISEQ